MLGWGAILLLLLKIQHPVFLKKSKKYGNNQLRIVSQQNGVGGRRKLQVSSGCKNKNSKLLHLFIEKNQREKKHPQCVYLSFPFHQEDKHLHSFLLYQKKRILSSSANEDDLMKRKVLKKSDSWVIKAKRLTPWKVLFLQIIRWGKSWIQEQDLKDHFEKRKDKARQQRLQQASCLKLFCFSRVTTELTASSTLVQNFPISGLMEEP